MLNSPVGTRRRRPANAVDASSRVQYDGAVSAVHPLDLAGVHQTLQWQAGTPTGLSKKGTTMELDASKRSKGSKS